MPSLIRIAALLTLLGAPARVDSAETLEDARLGFSLQLPDGFQPHPELIARQPSIAHAYMAHDADGQKKYLLQIAPMGGLLDRQRLTEGQFPPEFKGKLFPAQWKDFDVEAFETPEEQGEFKVLTYTVNVPLRREAIQVSLSGKADRKEELQTLFATLLENLKGESNWTIAPALSPVLLGISIAFILVGVVAMWVASRRSDAKVVLVVAGLMWFAGGNLTKERIEGRGDGRIREMKLAGSSVQMVGVIGGIIALVQLSRKPRQTPPLVPPQTPTADTTSHADAVVPTNESVQTPSARERGLEGPASQA